MSVDRITASRRLWPTCLGALLVVAGLHGAACADWKADWEKTLAAAKKEGRVNL